VTFNIVGSSFYLNTTVATVSSSNVSVFSPSGNNYSASSYSESMYNNNSRSGHVEIKDLNVSNNLLVGGNAIIGGTTKILGDTNITGNVTMNNNSMSGSLNVTDATTLSSCYFSGMPGAYCIDGNLSGIQYPIYYSIPNYNDFYSKSTATVLAMTGNICTDMLNMNDKDNYYNIMPGYTLVVYDTINWTGLVTLSVYNTKPYPIVVQPTNYDRGSSCRLYYNGYELN
jgi:NDP-sugar pyrophosphorylase family protein